MSLLYSDLPVYVSAPNDDSPGETNRYVAATQANVSFSVNNVGKRLFGSNVDATDQFRFGEGGVTANISFSTILDPAFNGGLGSGIYCLYRTVSEKNPCAISKAPAR